MSKNQPKSLTLLAIIFTGVVAFLTYEIPNLMSNMLSQKFPDIHPIINPDEIEAFINTVRPIGYILLIIIVILIILGFLIKKEVISVSSSFLLFLPTFGNFILSMFFLAGIGIIGVVWIPLDTPFFNFLTLGNVFFVPIYLFSFLLFIHPIFFYVILYFPWIIMIIGLYIFNLGVINWFYGKYQKKEIIDFSLYQKSRHPQYLGMLIWSYGLFIHYMTYELIYVVAGKFSLKASLPWVIFALIIVGVAFLEDINLSNKYPEKYAEYRKRTPFLIKLPKALRSIVSFPLRFILKKKFPETRSEILKVVVFYGVIIILLSALILLIYPPFF